MSPAIKLNISCKELSVFEIEAAWKFKLVNEGGLMTHKQKSW